MRYRVLGQLKGATGWAECELEAPVPAGTGLQWEGPVTGRVELTRHGSEYSAQGELRATVLMPCRRCTALHPVALQVEIQERIALEQVDEPQAYREEEDQAGPIPVLSGETVDLSELVRQMLVLHAPAHSLCRPDCRGLCPHCGADLNRDRCACPATGGDPRLAALRDLL